MVWDSEALNTLIDFVREHAFLYDPSKPKYYDRETVFNSWNFIGEKIGRKGSQVRTMWRQMVKIYAWINSGHYKVDDGCYWPYLEKLKFLKPFLGNYTVGMNLSYGEEFIDYEASLEVGLPVAAFITYKSFKSNAAHPVCDDNSQLQNDENGSESEFPQQDMNFLSDPELKSPFPGSLNGLAVQKNLEIEEALCQYLRKKVTKVKDPNELFLTSVAHDMKMLSSVDQAVFKMKVQQLLVDMISKSNCGKK
ncbi:uncharacterized protein [Hetaerina americana]|uniref:uncharacterized protein n=1 Tax=Hetaerina americana TaxID=62018 RepID=UPI003A7F21E4